MSPFVLELRAVTRVTAAARPRCTPCAAWTSASGRSRRPRTWRCRASAVTGVAVPLLAVLVAAVFTPGRLPLVRRAD